MNQMTPVSPVIDKQFLDKHYVKITLGVLFSCALMLIYGTSMVNGVSNSITNIGNKAEESKQRIEALEKRVNSMDLVLVEIKTQLVNIYATQIEIKQDIKNR